MYQQKIITLVYIRRKNYCFCKNFKFPVFCGFTRFRKSWMRFHYVWKLSVCPCAWNKKCVTQKPNLLVYIDFERKLFYSWHCCLTFFLISSICGSRNCMKFVNQTVTIKADIWYDSYRHSSPLGPECFYFLLCKHNDSISL